MAKLTEEEMTILQKAKVIQDRLEAERLEAGEEPELTKSKANPSKQTNHPPNIQKSVSPQKTNGTRQSMSSGAQRAAPSNQPASGGQRLQEYGQQKANQTAPSGQRQAAYGGGQPRPGQTAPSGQRQAAYGGQPRSGQTAPSGQRQAAYGGQPRSGQTAPGGQGQAAYGGQPRSGQTAPGGQGQAAYGGGQPRPGQTAPGGQRQAAYGGQPRSGQTAPGGQRQAAYGGGQSRPGQTAPGGQGQAAYGGGQPRPGQTAPGGQKQPLYGGQTRSVQTAAGGQPKTGRTDSGEQRQAAHSGQTSQTTLSNQRQSASGQSASNGQKRVAQSGMPKKERVVQVQPTLERQRTPKKKKKKSAVKVLLIILLVLVLIVAIAFGVLFSLIRSQVSRTNYEAYESNYVRAADVISSKDVKNILLIGTDERAGGEESRSDAIIVLSINEKGKKIVLTSILRDSYVTIPGYGQNRINHAYQVGGAPLLVQTIEENFKLGIDSYAKVDFYSFMDIIDVLGGVSVTVTPEEWNYLNGYISEINHIIGAPEGDQFLPSPGTFQLNGRQALAYSRIRYVGTDFARTERQRTILEGLFRQTQSASAKQLYQAFTKILPDVTTNIGDTDLTLLLFQSVLYMKYDIIQNRVPMDGTWQNADANGQEVLGIDFAANQAGLKSIIYGD